MTRTRLWAPVGIVALVLATSAAWAGGPATPTSKISGYWNWWIFCGGKPAAACTGTVGHPCACSGKVPQTSAADPNGAAGCPMKKCNRLTLTVGLEFKDTPLRQIIQDLCAIAGLRPYMDVPALTEEGVSLEYPISVRLESVSLEKAFDLVLRPMHLTYVLEGGILKVTTQPHACAKGTCAGEAGCEECCSATGKVAEKKTGCACCSAANGSAQTASCCCKGCQCKDGCHCKDGRCTGCTADANAEGGCCANGCGTTCCGCCGCGKQRHGTQTSAVGQTPAGKLVIISVPLAGPVACPVPTCVPAQELKSKVDGKRPGGVSRAICPGCGIMPAMAYPPPAPPAPPWASMVPPPAGCMAPASLAVPPSAMVGPAPMELIAHSVRMVALQLRHGKDALHIQSPHLEGTCGSVILSAPDSARFEGHVHLTHDRRGQHMELTMERGFVCLKDGEFNFESAPASNGIVPCYARVVADGLPESWCLKNAENGIQITGLRLEGSCDRVTMLDEGRMILEGHVRLKTRNTGCQAEVTGDCISVRLDNGAIQLPPLGRPKMAPPFIGTGYQPAPLPPAPR